MSNGAELIMPKLGLTMTEGTISEWMIAPGDSFKKNDVVLVVETEKIANEIEAPADGVLHDILVPAGETVSVGVALAQWDVGNASIPQKPEDAPSEVVENAETTPVSEKPVTSAPTAPKNAGSKRIIATPLAKRIADQNDIDLTLIAGSGPRGRIKADDVRSAISHGVAPTTPSSRSSERRNPSSYEATVARRLTEAKRDTPHFYLSTEVDAGKMLTLRQQLNEENDGLKISINHLVIAAVARALEDNEKANCVWQEGEILTYETIDVGVAVSTEIGLFAPLIRNLRGLGIASIATSARAVIEKTREGKLSSEDMADGATTISNAGMFDVTYMSSIINPGQSSILGVGSIRDTFRPNKKGKPILKQEMGLVLSCDHRIFDGVSGLAFLNSIKSYLEKPLRLLVN
ncbi:dihydrolipoamide acetyltransferase family protein [uncultured Sneathiella sp.]|uniref:dihydrolipoamide acetyltransferase family protein n=1 Tax=uncultured Sneathiella sp. TaxID=879315 RepID=UPI0030D849DF|tara:strand:+ start:767 stop:1978 length:1212 start_codon:yes stop_codon:yes gene_type:complete